MNFTKIENYKETLYVSRSLLYVDELVKWVKEQNFKYRLPNSEFHVTIVYSKEKVDWNKAKPINNILIIKGGVRKVEKLGDAIVLQFQSKKLKKRWEYFINDVGCSWDYPSYKSHVSITYDSQNIDYEKMKPYEGYLIFGPEKFIDVNENHKENFKEIKI